LRFWDFSLLAIRAGTGRQAVQKKHRWDLLWIAGDRVVYHGVDATKMFRILSVNPGYRLDSLCTWRVERFRGGHPTLPSGADCCCRLDLFFIGPPSFYRKYWRGGKNGAL
jgi:hypothetical protein